MGYRAYLGISRVQGLGLGVAQKSRACFGMCRA